MKIGVAPADKSHCPFAPNYASTMQPRNPLHGITLEQLLVNLVERMGWEAMGAAVPIRCFTHDPSIASSCG